MRVVLCADDYGISDGVSRAVLELAAAGRISATSAITASAAWPSAARALEGVAGIGIGLHLTLTGLSALGPMPGFAPGGRFPSVDLVVSGALRGQLPLGEIAAEIDRQLTAFGDAMGRAPDFIDGHQHVHALPGIRRVLIEVLMRRGVPARVWIRDPFERPGAILVRGVAVPKALAVAALSVGFGRAVRRAGFSTNRGFSGFSRFDPLREFGTDFARFLAAPGPAHLVMCHPGHVALGEALDGVADTREQEFAYLMSDAFPTLLAERGIALDASPIQGG